MLPRKRSTRNLLNGASPIVAAPQPWARSSDVPLVQKGAELIDNDQRFATFVATSVLTLVLSLSVSSGAVRAAEVADTEDSQPIIVTFVRDGQSTMFETHARSVAQFLDERGVKLASDDFVAPALETPLAAGMRLEYRSAMALTLVVDGQRLPLHCAPATVADLLARQGVILGPYDEVSPALGAHPAPGAVVRVVRIDEWTAREREPIEPGVRHRFDPALAIGKTRTVDQGLPGERELTVRFIKRGDAPEKRVVLASRVLQEARPKIVVHGIGEFASIVDGVRDALHIAGTAMKMVATAYVPFCSGCSGITKLGLHAGHGVVAVDPNVIPLGSRLYVPGYGNAVAGDTGGAIRGNRIDLGFNNLGEALRFGRRPITVYVLR
jgi:uncharacterized protein YabE (DUF348 family)